MYDAVHTSFDVMKEFLITGAELTEEYQIPKIPPCQLDTPPEDSIDFEESFSRKIKNHRKLNVNFYIDDTKFTSKPGDLNPGKAHSSCLLYAYNLIISHDKRQIITNLVVFFVIIKAVDVAV